MVLTLIGLGLGSHEDITVKGLNAIREADKVYLEAYTSLLCDVNKATLEATYGKSITEADREFVELGCQGMLEEAKTKNIAFLVVGDPFGATTHADLFLRAKEVGVEVTVIHNASILNAVGCTGLQLYQFGQTVSIPFFDGEWKPRSYVDKIAANIKMGLHTLVLLDIKVKEQTVENMMKRNNVFEPPRFMTINQAIEQILYFTDDQNECKPDTKAFGVARIGSTTQQVVSGTLDELRKVDFGPPLHSLVICAPTLHEVEAEFYQVFHL